MTKSFQFLLFVLIVGLTATVVVCDTTDNSEGKESKSFLYSNDFVVQNFKFVQISSSIIIK